MRSLQLSCAMSEVKEKIKINTTKKIFIKTEVYGKLTKREKPPSAGGESPLSWVGELRSLISFFFYAMLLKIDVELTFVLYRL
jgi:hypothetical protein